MELMQHERHTFEDASFPVLIHIDRLGDGRPSVYSNWHLEVELLYCVEGCMRLLLDTEALDCGAGQIAVIGSNALHTIHALSRTCVYHCMIISSEFLHVQGFDVERAGASAVIDDPSMRALFDRVVREHSAAEPHYKPAVLSAVLGLFVLLWRNHIKPRQVALPPMEHDYPLPIMQSLRYIREHLCERMTVDELSQHIGLSKFHFCRMFRAYTGASVVHYINTLRCDYAHRLIIESGLTASEAAHRLGIHNLSYFSKMFKQYMGMAPSELYLTRGD